MCWLLKLYFILQIRSNSLFLNIVLDMHHVIDEWIKIRDKRTFPTNEDQLGERVVPDQIHMKTRAPNPVQFSSDP